MKWLVDVLDEALPELTGGDRDKLARAILEALPKDVIATAIADACHSSLQYRAIRDGARDVSQFIGDNAAQAVIAMLTVEPDDDSEPESRRLPRHWMRGGHGT